jgi:hypothetical protein
LASSWADLNRAQESAEPSLLREAVSVTRAVVLWLRRLHGTAVRVREAERPWPDSVTPVPGRLPSDPKQTGRDLSLIGKCGAQNAAHACFSYIPIGTKRDIAILGKSRIVDTSYA